MIDRNKYANLAEALADVTDIGKVVRAVVRETAIREMMAETGETREAVTTVADAAVSMDEEAVLDLMDGQPTTIGRALARYIGKLEKELTEDPNDEETGRNSRFGEVVEELDILLRYPWPGAAPAEDELARFRQDVAVTLRRKFQTALVSPAVDEVVAEIEALAKDRFFPGR